VEPLSVDHLDPSISGYICGFDIDENIRIISLKQNKKKSNAFVPYRLYEEFQKPPRQEGQICLFLINEEWKPISFGGEKWWEEVFRLGYSRTNTRGSKWYTDGEVALMLHPDEEVPPGFIQGRIYTGWSITGLQSPIKNKLRAHNPETSEDGFFNAIPANFIAGVPPEKRKPRGYLPSCTRTDILYKKDEIIQAYLLGDSTVVLGEHYNTSARTINNWLTKWEIPKRSTSRKNRKDKKPRKTEGYLKNKNA